MSSGSTAKVLFEYVAEQEDELTLGIGDIITNVIQEDDGWWKGEVNGRSGMFPENFVALIKTQPAEENVSSTFKALVKFDYEPEQNDELALSEGEIIEVIDITDEGWWKGRIHGKEGVFPSNFVEKADASKLSEPVREPVNKPLPLPDTESLKQPENAGEAPQSNVMASLFSGIKPGDARSRLKKIAKPPEENNSSPPSHESPFQHEALKPTQKVPPMNLDHEETKKKLPMIPPTDPPKVTKTVQKAKALYDYEPEQSDELKLSIGMVITVIASELTFDGWMKGEVDGNVGVFPDNFVELLPLEQSEQPSVDVQEEAAPKPQHGKPPPMLPPGGSSIQSELTKRLAQKSPSNPPSMPPLNTVKNKAPPPPLPGNKPSLPGTKPKPTIPHSKPVKPPFVKPESTVDPKPLVQNEQSIPKPFGKVENQPLIPKPFGKVESKPPVVNMHKTPDIDDKAPALANTTSKPSVQSPVNNELNRKMSPSHKTSHVKDSKTENSEIKLDESPSPLKVVANKEEEKADEKLENGHSKISGQPSLHLSDVKPTDPLKHFDRVKPPGKQIPSKFKSPPPSSSPSSDPKEVNELKTQVTELQTKMADMEEQFKKLLTQVRDDLDTERKLRLSQQVELDSLKKKVDVWLG